jgi:hypothetical protein
MERFVIALGLIEHERRRIFQLLEEDTLDAGVAERIINV